MQPQSSWPSLALENRWRLVCPPPYHRRSRGRSKSHHQGGLLGDKQQQLPHDLTIYDNKLLPWFSLFPAFKSYMELRSQVWLACMSMSAPTPGRAWVRFLRGMPPMPPPPCWRSFLTSKTMLPCLRRSITISGPRSARHMQKVQGCRRPTCSIATSACSCRAMPAWACMEPPTPPTPATAGGNVNKVARMEDDSAPSSPPGALTPRRTSGGRCVPAATPVTAAAASDDPRLPVYKDRLGGTTTTLKTLP